jgi:hypothetical protein
MNRSAISLLSAFTKASKPVQMNVARFSTKNVARTFIRTPITRVIPQMKQLPFGNIRSYNNEEGGQRRKQFRQEAPLTTNILLVRAPVGVDIQAALGNFGVVENGVNTFETGSTPYIFVEFNSAEDATRALRFIRSRSKNPSSEIANTSASPSSAEEIETLRQQSQKPSTVAVLPKVPFYFTEADLKEVFPGFKFTSLSVGHGKGYVKFATPEEADKFVAQSGVATIGKYPVAIYKSISFDMDKHAKNPVVTVKIRGHPAETTEEEIREFLSGLNVTRVVMNAVEIPGGRVISEVYVTFPDSQSVDAAVAKDREKIGSRWVSVRRSSNKEIRKALERKRQQENSYGGSDQE